MTQNKIIEQQFESPLGIVRCGIKCDSFDMNLVEKKKYKNGQSEIYTTIGHKIEFISFKIKLPLYNGETVTDGCGWVFRVKKINNISELIEIYCILDSEVEGLESYSNCGEHLDAIRNDNQFWTLHIGTEDGEILNSRAEIDDWFPLRLKGSVNFNKSITAIKNNSLLTVIPKLNKGEKIHIQYLTAYDKHENDKVNTWLAVDEFKHKLEDWIGL